jgi:hypothetical protein
LEANFKKARTKRAIKLLNRFPMLLTELLTEIKVRPNELRSILAQKYFVAQETTRHGKPAIIYSLSNLGLKEAQSL